MDVPAVLDHCLPVVGGILAMQAVHEAAHHAVAKGWQLKLGKHLTALGQDTGRVRASGD